MIDSSTSVPAAPRGGQRGDGERSDKDRAGEQHQAAAAREPVAGCPEWPQPVPPITAAPRPNGSTQAARRGRADSSRTFSSRAAASWAA